MCADTINIFKELKIPLQIQTSSKSWDGFHCVTESSRLTLMPWRSGGVQIFSLSFYNPGIFGRSK